MGQLDGKVAIITGAGRGLGAAIARAFAVEGGAVVLSGPHLDELEGLAGEIGAAAGAVRCDVTVEAQVAGLISHVLERHGRLDVMVANAGIAGTPGPVVSSELADWRRVQTVNLDGVFLAIKHAAPAMIAGGGGSIITMASVTATGGVPLGASYAASKAAVVSLTRTAALELRPHGVRVNALCPGFIATDMVAEIAQPFSRGIGMDLGEIVGARQGRMGVPADVAPVAVYLAADRSALATGAAFMTDGGLTASLL